MLLLKSIFLVCSAAVVMARGNPDAVVSGGLFVGEDTTNPDASAVDIYKYPENYASAVASILQYSAVTTDYRPSQPDATAKSGYSGFQRKASTFPGFILTANSEGDIPLDGSLIQLEEAVREEYPSTDSILIARSLRDLFPGYVEDSSLKEWVLSLVVIRKPFYSDTVTFKLVQLELTIATDKAHSTYIPEQTARLSSSEFQVNAAVLTNKADQFAEIIPRVDVQGFINYFASPKVPEESEDVLERGSHSCRQEMPSFASRLQQVRLARWMDV
ncbi:hypothetical protein BG000_011720 [Podila horticola]|nr:hypothetical protein BG000_011720 [Podila horticola]